MTDPSPYAVGPPPGYVPPKARPTPPADDPDARVAEVRGELARVGPACGCGHGPLTHRHATPTAQHCAICDCTGYHRDQGGSPA